MRRALSDDRWDLPACLEDTRALCRLDLGGRVKEAHGEVLDLSEVHELHCIAHADHT